MCISLSEGITMQDIIGMRIVANGAVLVQMKGRMAY